VLYGAVMKTALTLELMLALSVLSLFVSQFVNVTKANPYMMYEDVDPPPGTIPTQITISSPKNNTRHLGSVYINIRATGPQPPYSKESGIYLLAYNIDNTISQSIKKGLYSVPEVSYSQTLHDLPVGNRNLTVFAYGRADLGNMQGFIMVRTSTVYFSVGNTDYSPTPSPSPIATPSPSQEPTATPYEVGVQNASLYLASGGMFAFTLVSVFLGLLLYLIKRK